ncbi:MAG: hypothetical protein FRX48_05406 [Lasallia pustulata]|uniref:UBC core domain-containing protein n=1 Tax=Lasallia pustulata TaxID=136370 RepID=A0A5M8PQ87_9LECA|nr:MAG: hypothetical protein FRX48_05406 [Lasallia pustulata]
MSSSTLRRLAKDHKSLHADLPPNFLFSPSSASESVPDDLTRLTILLAGPQGTPYSRGVWKLQIKIPDDYPRSPPKAAFRTRIWHPNVEESTGSVCVETLKRDWDPKLTLRDVLITISCLLIQPNPDSALNSAAGQLLQEDYEAYARQAKLMTSIHAMIPTELRDAVVEAKKRGEEAGTEIREDEEQELKTTRHAFSSSLLRKRAPPSSPSNAPPGSPDSKPPPLSQDDEDSSPSSAHKKNDPSLPPPVPPPPPPPHPRQTPPLRPPHPPDPEDSSCEDPTTTSTTASSSQNIAANSQNIASAFPPRRSPKLATRSKLLTAPGRHSSNDPPLIPPFEDASSSPPSHSHAVDDEVDAPPHKRVCSAEGKENFAAVAAGGGGGDKGEKVAKGGAGAGRQVGVGVGRAAGKARSG